MTPYYGNRDYLGSKFEHSGTPSVHDARFEVPFLTCRPCSKIGFERCPKGHFNCMNQQNTEAIANALQS
jgi:hypothetical protein